MVFYKSVKNVWYEDKEFLTMAQNFIPAFAGTVEVTFTDSYLVEYLKSNGCIKDEQIIDNPTVVDYLKMDMTVEAARRYRDIHGCGSKQACEMVKKVAQDIKEFKKKQA